LNDAETVKERVPYCHTNSLEWKVLFVDSKSLEVIAEQAKNGEND